MPFPTTSVLTNFTSANEDPLSLGGLFAAASVFNSGARCRLTSNTCAAHAITTTGSSYWATSFGADAEAFVTLSAKWTTDNVGFFVMTNIQTPNTSTVSFYMCTGYDVSGVSRIEIYRIDNNSTFNLLGAAVTGLTVTAGDKFGLQNVGGTLTAYQNTGSGWNLLATRTDTTYGAGFIGLGADNDVAIRMDDFGGGTAIVGGPTMRHWGGVPFIGGAGVAGCKGGDPTGRMWGRFRDYAYDRAQRKAA